MNRLFPFLTDTNFRDRGCPKIESPLSEYSIYIHNKWYSTGNAIYLQIKEVRNFFYEAADHEDEAIEKSGLD